MIHFSGPKHRWLRWCSQSVTKKILEVSWVTFLWHSNRTTTVPHENCKIKSLLKDPNTSRSSYFWSVDINIKIGLIYYFHTFSSFHDLVIARSFLKFSCRKIVTLPLMIQNSNSTPLRMLTPELRLSIPPFEMRIFKK